MNTLKICFYGELRKLSQNYHQILLLNKFSVNINRTGYSSWKLTKVMYTAFTNTGSYISQINFIKLYKGYINKKCHQAVLNTYTQQGNDCLLINYLAR